MARARPGTPGPAAGPLGGPFWRLWGSSGLSNLADGVLRTAIPLIAVRSTDSPALIAGLSVALTLPWLLFALPVGALTDRHDRRRLMVLGNAARILVLGALAIAAVFVEPGVWMLYAAAFLLGTAEVVYDTSAQSILPQLVDRPMLPRANARLTAAELTTNQFAGPPLGGLVVAAGAAIALGAPAALWVLALVLLLSIRGDFRVARDDRAGRDDRAARRLGADIAEGLRHLWRNPLLRTLGFMVGTFNFASNAAFAVFVLYAVGPDSAMGLDDAAYGLLITTLAVGSLVGTLVAAPVVARIGRSWALGLSIAIGAIGFAVPALTANVWLVGAAFAVSGVGVVVWNVITVSFRQHIVPDRLLGRVNSGYRLLAWGTLPLGAFVGGLLGEWLGVPSVFGIAAALILLVLLGMLVVNGRSMERAEAAVDEAPPAGDAVG